MIKNYFALYSQKYASKWLVLAIDLAIVMTTFCMAYFIRFNFSLDFNVEQFTLQLPFIFSVSLISFLIVGSFKSVIRHTGFTDVINLFKSVVLIAFIIAVCVLFNNRLQLVSNFTVPKTIIVLHAIISFLFLSASRLVFKMAFKHLKCKLLSTKRILIYGAGDQGIITYNALLNNTASSYIVVGFIDDNVKKKGKNIDGVPIMAFNRITSEFAAANNIDEIVVASVGIGPAKLIALVDNLSDVDVKITKVPPIENWINGELSSTQIKQVQIEDLLGRAPIEINNPNLENEFSGETVLVTGAAGSIGSELVRQLAEFNVKHLILVDQAESPLYDVEQDLKRAGKRSYTAIVADIRDGLRIDSIFQEYNQLWCFMRQLTSMYH